MTFSIFCYKIRRKKKDFFKKIVIFTKIPTKAILRFMETIGIGLFINTGDSRAFIILIESLLILTVVALSSIFLKD
ncbi:hypothetical protein EIY27_06005 [Campylobacter jejuni]|uniref:Uncharacterized protein n=1 Tax=Campylobacter jejuni TaxID=197 RepID=A0A5T1W0S6_CAMJU|nr:hypothetical protein [Campylobacter jejuni]PJQ00721.1 hypothetical protein CV381_08235 [Campylobacter jejuni subsp. jejuni]EAH4872309.1 hypothetical protein [Campylobacter jejuni]EAH5071100.1 hypothetical protein [Campylobacter jejuni]EAH5183342.1 hypothetical protein [Campylobacter jejuni]